MTIRDQTVELEEILRALETESGRRWFGQLGLMEGELQQLENRSGRQLPEPVAWWLRHSNGGEWVWKPPTSERYYVMLDANSIEDVAKFIARDLPGMFPFASDGGSKYFVLDETNRHGRGANSIWGVPAGAPFEDRLEYIASDIAMFLRQMIEGSVGRRISQ